MVATVDKCSNVQYLDSILSGWKYWNNNQIAGKVYFQHFCPGGGGEGHWALKHWYVTLRPK